MYDKRMPCGHPFVLYIKFMNETYRSVYEFPEFAEYGKLIAFALVIVVATADDSGVNIETFGNGDDFIRQFFVYVYFHAVSHIEDFIHLFPRSAGLFLNQPEQRRNGEKVVFDNVHVVYEVHDFGLCSAGAMHHAVNPVTVAV